MCSQVPHNHTCFNASDLTAMQSVARCIFTGWSWLQAFCQALKMSSHSAEHTEQAGYHLFDTTNTHISTRSDASEKQVSSRVWPSEWLAQNKPMCELGNTQLSVSWTPTNMQVGSQHVQAESEVPLIRCLVRDVLQKLSPAPLCGGPFCCQPLDPP